tara:strand:- start:273 stop:623 length:351 start_codon:yes stop_codon:yes gene_type:complete
VTGDNLHIETEFVMSDKNQFSQNAISHKELNDFLIKARKDTSLNDSSENNILKEEEVFNDLVNSWSETSQKILLMMNNKEKVFTKNKNPKSIMAFGAMGVHINMALQALKATETEQ